jgi:hypothetical protein
MKMLSKKSIRQILTATLVAVWIVLLLANQSLEKVRLSQSKNKTEEKASGETSENTIVEVYEIALNNGSQINFQFPAIALFEEKPKPEGEQSTGLFNQFCIAQSKNFKILLQRIISTNAP